MVENSAPRDCEYGKGHVVYKPPEERPRLRFGPKGATTLTIEFDLEQAKIFRGTGFPGDRAFAFQSAYCAAVARRILRELRSPDVFTPLAIEGLALELFAEIMRRKTGPARRPPQWLQEVRSRVVTQSDRRLRLRDLAETVQVHPVYLAQAFRAFYGQSIGECRRDSRMEQAVRLLETDRSLVQIAMESGFCDQSHFCRAFRRATGFTPAEYRRMFRRP